MARSRPNSRLKDLPDLALLGTAAALDAARIREAIDLTFSFRATHAVPAHVPAPPDEWRAAYTTLAREDQLPWSTLADVTAAARAFLDPALAGVRGTWRREIWSWQ